MAEIVGKFLGIKGINVSISHAGMSFPERKKAIESIQNGESSVAVCTNVLARGIDIPKVRVVLNFELPRYNDRGTADTKRYLYRIGRASRFGSYFIFFNELDNC